MPKGFLSRDELEQMGFEKLGENVLISEKASIYEPQKMSIGNNVRIDDFSILVGNVTLGSYVHIAAFCSLGGSHGVVMEDFSGLSSRVAIFSSSDDYSGRYLTNPTVPGKYSHAISGMVRLGRHVIIGVGSVILPKVSIGEGTAIGAMSLVNKSLDPWGIYAGVPARYVKARSKELLDIEKQLMTDIPFN